MDFETELTKYSWNDIQQQILLKTTHDVEVALSSSKRSIHDFMALVSPAALPYLEQMAQLSRMLTRRRFGNIIQLYIPLYLSNFCSNACVYCGFNSKNKFQRIVLSPEQVYAEAKVIREMGFKHILLVTGESSKADVPYFKIIMDELRKTFSLISLEVQPLEESQYKELIHSGLHTVYLYQETYNQKTYASVHPAGKKADYAYRLNTFDRMGRAGIHRMGLGVLLGLDDWRTDSVFTAIHLRYLQKTYWQTKYSISFPRIRPELGGFVSPNPVKDDELLQLICAYRLFDEDLELSLSTRENPYFRDHVLQLGITSMSAGSKTQPGGYSNPAIELEQFEVHDRRSPLEIAEVIRKAGLEPVWKDWDVSLQTV